MRMLSKKRKIGALDISINSIVVIIFAITMLGLGLAFIRGMFGKVQEKVTFPEPEIAATAADPIVLPFETMVVHRGTQAEFTINFYNDGPNAVTIANEPSIACNAGIASDYLTVVAQAVDVGETATYKALLAVGTTTSGKYICTLTIGSATKQFFIEVK